MGAVVIWMERQQVPLYIAAIALGAVVGIVAPSTAPLLATSINPVLGLLLFATFLGVPLIEVGNALRDLRFLSAVFIVNFFFVPLAVWGLSRFVAGNQALLVGVLLVLLTPCVDYVIVFTGLAGGARARLIAATPLLMLAQIVLLPVFLFLFAGPRAVSRIDVVPFVKGFLFLIAIPLIAAALVQFLSRTHRAGVVVRARLQTLMVPLTMMTLAVVIGSQVHSVGARLGQLLLVVPLFVAFLVVMLIVGLVAGKIVELDIPAQRALVFSGTTRNSLVVLPLALSLPTTLNLAPLVVVTQTFVELVAMIIFVRLIPRLIPHRDAAPSRTLL